MSRRARPSRPAPGRPGAARRRAARAARVDIIEVARILTAVGEVDDAVTLVGAVLHDTVEDTDATLNELERRFGAEVRHVVEEVTDDRSLSKQERKRLQIERAPSLSSRAKQIKIADKISNVREIVRCPPVGWSMERRREYLDWADAVVAGCRGVNPRLDRYYEIEMRASRTALEAEGS